MSDLVTAQPGQRLLLTGNEAVARGVWEAGAAVAAAYPGTPSTEILEQLGRFPGLHAEWSVNEKVALEVAIGASLTGARGFAAMKQVGLNVAADPLMSQTLAGVIGGLVIAVADDIGISSSQNEQDSRYWGRFGHLPVFEPADAQEALAMVREAFALSEQFETPVLLRLTTRVCHVKNPVTVGARESHPASGFHFDANRWVMTPATAKRRLPGYHARDVALRAASEAHPLNAVHDGPDRRVGFVTSGPAYMHVREAFPDAPILKLGLGTPAPLEKIRAFAATVDTLVIAEEVEPLLETEARAAGIACRGKDLLPRMGELTPDVLLPALAPLLGGDAPAPAAARPAPAPNPGVFPRPPTMCPGCPHLGLSVCLSRLRKNLTIPGDIGCYALAYGPPWNALDTAICMGSSMGIALGVDKARGDSDPNRRIVAVIGDSTFLHTGMPGLLNIVYNGGNVTVVIADNRAVGMTGGQDHPASGRDLRGEPAPSVDFAKLVEALGVKPERIHLVDPYQLPVLFRTLREESKVPEPSVIITNQPCVLIDQFTPRRPYRVVADACTGCGNCLDVGCPVISVTRREMAVKPNGQEKELFFVAIDSSLCTGCDLCAGTCGPDAIVHVEQQLPRMVAAPAGA
ncbi:MAG TPA: thiamine pyrophosphate-dependent enzyme [Gammaproteobacteria bacterium]